MFLLLFIGLPLLEVLAFVGVGAAIGWLLAVLLLIGISLLGFWLLRIQGRAALERVSLAVSERRSPGRPALDGALGFLGCVLLAVPGFVTDLLGAILLLRPTRALAHRWISRRYAHRVMRFAQFTGRFAPGRSRARPDDVQGTAFEEQDRDRLGR